MENIVGALVGILFCMPFVLTFVGVVIGLNSIFSIPIRKEDEYVGMALAGPLESDVIAPYE